MICTLLFLHKDTLKTLDLGYLSPSSQGSLFDVSNFQSLEDLRLSRGQMAVNLGSPVSDADLLLAPNLKTFEWNFTVRRDYYQDFSTWCKFGNEEENWLRGFMDTAITRQSTLSRIEITNLSNGWHQPQQEDHQRDRIHAIRSDYRLSRITIAYDSPTCSPDYWEKWRLGSGYDGERPGSIDYESERSELESTDQETTDSESTNSESGDSDSI